MKRSKKRKLQKESTLDYEMVVRPIMGLNDSIKDMVKLTHTYFNDIKLMEIDQRLKFLLYREMKTGLAIREAQLQQLENILDECVDENGVLLDKKIVLFGNKQADITNESLGFIKLYERVTSITIDISDANFGLSRDLNKAITEVMSNLDKEEDKSKLEEFKMITARYYGCDVVQLEEAMSNALNAMRAQVDEITSTAVGQQMELLKMTKEGFSNGNQQQQ